jgi:hypothetical protein
MDQKLEVIRYEDVNEEPEWIKLGRVVPDLSSFASLAAYSRRLFTCATQVFAIM